MHAWRFSTENSDMICQVIHVFIMVHVYFMFFIIDGDMDDLQVGLCLISFQHGLSFLGYIPDSFQSFKEKNTNKAKQTER